VDRIRRLPLFDFLHVGIGIREARSFRARLLGLAFLDPGDGDDALLIRRCRSVHTFGMRFPIDVVFVDRDWRVVRIVRDVGPRRVVRCRGADAVIEVLAGEGDRLRAGLSLWRARAGGS
jgi:uncharacterized membrane protein (UPF0127 family)